MDLNVDVYPQKPAGIIGLALHEISFHHNEKTMIEWYIARHSHNTVRDTLCDTRDVMLPPRHCVTSS